MGENAWICAILAVAAIVAIYAAIYKWIENKEKKALGKSGYRRMHSPEEWQMAAIAKKRKNDRSYFAAASKNLGKEWKYEYKSDPYLCEITYTPKNEDGKMAFLVPRQEGPIADALIFYKKVGRETRLKAVKTLLKAMS